MSKTQLKKLLAQMTAPQIAELVVDLYEARPEAKDYLEFFVNPNIDARLEKARVAIKREVERASRGRSKMRPTRLRKAIKDIASLNPGAEAVCEIMTYTVEAVCGLDAGIWIKESTRAAIAKMLTETVAAADRAGLLNLYLPRLERAVAGMKSTLFRPNHFKSPFDKEC